MNNLIKTLLGSGGRNYSAVARLVGVTPAAVCSWAHGRAKPRLKTARKLQKYCQIPLSFWGYEDIHTKKLDLSPFEGLFQTEENATL